MMREAVTVEVNFAMVSIYITSLWDVLLGVLGRETVHQAQQAQAAVPRCGRLKAHFRFVAHEEGCWGW